MQTYSLLFHAKKTKGNSDLSVIYIYLIRRTTTRNRRTTTKFKITH